MYTTGKDFLPCSFPIRSMTSFNPRHCRFILKYIHCHIFVLYIMKMLLTLLYIRYFYNFTNILLYEFPCISSITLIYTSMIKTQNVVKLLQIITTLSTKSLNGYYLRVFYTYVSTYYVIYTNDFNRETKQILISF